MRRLFIILCIAACASSCMTAVKEETPSDRAQTMVQYARTKTDKEVRYSLDILALARRLDVYRTIPDKDRRESKWSDLYGQVYFAEDGSIEMANGLSFECEHDTLSVAGSNWKTNYVSITALGKDTWMCCYTPNGEDNILLATLSDETSGTWNLEYTSSETYEDKNSVISSSSLVGTCTGKYNEYYGNYWNGYASLLSGHIYVDFYSGTTKLDYVDLLWNGDEYTATTSRD